MNTSQYTVPCIYNKIKKNNILVSVPGSKSITNRALLVATLADGSTTLNGVLFSDDSVHFMNCIKELGIDATINEKEKTILINGCNGKLPKDNASIYVGSAGTAARFLTAVLGVANGEYHIDASEQMKKRPMAPLLCALRDIGCEITQDPDSIEDHFPFTLTSHGFQKSELSINIDSSSQFLSALLIASVLSDHDLTIDVCGSHGMSYVEMTIEMMKQFGVSPNMSSTNSISIESNSSYKSLCYDIEPDASAAAYFYAMCPLLNIQVCVPGIHYDSLQGDVEFINVLCQMGCSAIDTKEGIVLSPPTDGIIHGLDIDMSSFSDQAITLAALAVYADSPVKITGISHIRLQESDRLSAIASELTALGIKVKEESDAITIYPSQPKPGIIKTYEDHRMAMGFSLIGLRTPGIVIDNPMCCKKTFAEYFDVLDAVVKELTH